MRRDREIRGQQHTGKDVERETEARDWRHTERQRHEGWVQRQAQRWKDPRHGKGDEETDRSVGRETEIPGENGQKTGRDSHRVMETDVHIVSKWGEGHKKDREERQRQMKEIEREAERIDFH